MLFLLAELADFSLKKYCLVLVRHKTSNLCLRLVKSVTISKSFVLTRFPYILDVCKIDSNVSVYSFFMVEVTIFIHCISNSRQA